jgi:hypothetical protein
MKLLLTAMLFAISMPLFYSQTTVNGRWPEKAAWDWYRQTPWYCGFNYIPAYAIKEIETLRSAIQRKYSSK